MYYIHTNYISWIAFGLAIGSSIYFYINFEPTLFFILSFIPIVFFKKILKFFFPIILGFCVAKARILYINTDMLEEEQSNVILKGFVELVEDHPTKLNKYRILIKESKNRIIKFISKKHSFEPGDFVEIVCNLSPVPYPVSFFSPNWRRYHYLLSIGAIGKIKEVKTLITSKNSLNKYRHNLTNFLKNKLHDLNGSIAAALITGDRSSIPKNIKQSFADSGLSHILAISGLHISLVIAIVFFLIRRLLSLMPKITLFYPIKTISAIISIICSFFYLAISGFGYPAIRAFIMSCFILIGIMIGRQPFSIRSVGIAAIIILLIYPESVLSLSFQLSFIAVGSLITGYEFLYKKIERYNKTLKFFIGLISTTVIANLATLPIIIDSFGRVTLQSLLGNLIAIPLVSFFIMPSCVLCFVSLFKIEFVVNTFDFGINLLIKTAIFVSNLPGSIITLSKPNDFFLPLSLIATALIIFFKRKEGFIILFFSYFSLIFKKELPVIYVDKNIIAYRKNNDLFASSFKNKFAIETWMQESDIKNLYFWTSFSVNFDNYNLLIDPWKHKTKTNTFKNIITNGYIKGNATISRNMLDKKGTCFIINKKVFCIKDNCPLRPWS